MDKIKNLGITIVEMMKVMVERAKTDKKFLGILVPNVLAVMIAVVAIVVVGCGNGEGQGAGGGQIKGEKTSYTVSIKSQGGMALEGIDVAIYADENLTNMQDYAKTNEKGIVNFQLVKDHQYYIVLSGAPKGYKVEKSYAFSGDTAIITLASALITDDDISTAKLGLGDVMYDFTITTPDGEKITLSEVLKEKKMVLINFWYTSCSWCVTEFPIMAEAYEMYKDDIEILALNPLGEGAAAVKNFQQQHGLTFPTAECPTSWAQVFDVQGYPTSIIIDRYGVICAVEPGAITSLRPFVSAFEHFTADDYQQKLCANGVSDLVTQVKPTYTMPTSDEIAAIINGGDIQVSYRPEEGESAEFSWPFIIGEKNGVQCIYASNAGIEDSYGIIYADVTLKKGQAVGFDYLASSEKGCDIMYVIVNDEAIFNISGWDEKETWKTCYPCIADKDGTYEIALCYLKDSDTNEGDDTVYVKNIRVVNESQIDTATYIPRMAAVEKEDGEFTYADIVYNSADGYYHVGSKNGPILLADLMNYSQFNEEQAVYFLVSDDGEFIVNGKDCYNDFIQYCNYASNATISGVCPVTKTLAEYLKEIAKLYGFEDDDNEWLKICKYYAAYGTKTQLEDPIKGLAPFSAYKATLGKGVNTNYFYYDRAIIPRGMFAEFVPTVSGVYRITSHNDSEQGVDGWIFDENRNELLVYEHDERMYADDNDVSMVLYMEAGKSYYIDIAFWDVYEVGVITYDIEYVAATYELFRLASPGYFTYDSDATGNEMYHVIAGGIDVVLGKDGIYYEDLGKDANGNQIYGSKLYCDFTGVTGIFGSPIASNNGVKGMIELGGFDFSKTENDLYILGIMKSHNNSVDETDAYLKELWGEDYEAYAEEYQLKDVYKGRYHGEGEDLTDEISKYLSKMDNSGKVERKGCVVVDEDLAELLQMVMEKYTFEDVDHSWTKLCYYYDYLGPEK